MQRSFKMYYTEATTGLGSRWITDGKAVSGTDTYYGNVMTPNQYADLGFSLEFTGTPTGTLTLWYSDEDDPALATDTDWVQDTTWVPTNPAGSAIKTLYVVSGLRAKWARVKYVNASGTGTIFGYYGGDA